MPYPSTLTITLATLALSACASKSGNDINEGPGCDTRISGVVTAPNGIDPIPGARVYLPRTAPPPFSEEIRCEPCGPDEDQGVDVLASTTARADGHFTIQRLPTMADGKYALYVQKGRWRRRVEVKATACQENKLAAAEAHLPRSRAEGEIPSMAVAVGDFDAIECVLQHIGIDKGEFTGPNGTGAIHLYENEQRLKGGAPGQVGVERLLLDPRALRKYNLVLLNCTDLGGITPFTSDPLVQKNLLDYVSAGGRMYTTDWTYNFVAQQPAWSPYLCFEDGAACGVPGERRFQGAAIGFPGNFVSNVPNAGERPRTEDAVQGLLDWLALPQFALQAGVPITDLLLGWVLMTDTAPDTVHYPTLTWLHGKTNGADRPLAVTFDYPQPRACGRILYSSHHTRGHQIPGAVFPGYCPIDGVIPQERVLEYLLFEVGACVPILG